MKLDDRALLRFPCRDTHVSADEEFHLARRSAFRPIEGCLLLEPPPLYSELQPIFKSGVSAFHAASSRIIVSQENQ